MRFSTLDRLPVEPGRVVEFTPARSTLAAADRAAPSPVPPSFNQRFHLETARRQGPGHWLACAFDLPGPVDVEALRSAFVRWVRRHETLRSGFRAGERFVVAPEDFDLVAADPVPAPDPRALLRERIGAVCDPLSWPSSLFTVVLHARGGTVFCAFDHCDADGYSLALAVHELRELYRGAELPPVGSFVDYCAGEQASEVPPDRRAAATARWSEFLTACGGTSPAFPLALGVTPGQRPPQRMRCQQVLDARGAAAFERECRAAGGSVFAGVLAALAGAVHRLGGGEQVRVCAPLHTRNEPRWEHAIGWFTTVAPLELKVHSGFADTVRDARAAFREALAYADVPVPVALSGVDFRRDRDDVFMLSYIDYRRFPGAEHHVPAAAYHLSSVTTADDAQFWVSRTDEGLFLRARHPATAVADRTIESFADAFAEVLTSAVAVAA
ncbi:condensation domain-containing protein [Amycolatopsis anabasis]|uniref:condensation domain-containing protein n=1 Tax=Amycolatopsis anabasis TaxID=1840409 RepID=UPI00131D0436|nr:condensation domain-containing protein [Amycolatopsis anabasis]